MANIEIIITNRDVQDALGDLLNRLTEPAPVFAGISKELEYQVEQIFENEGPGFSALNANVKGRGTTSGGWPQLAPSTVKKRGSAHPILQISGNLARSFLPFSGDDHAGIGSNSPYAPIHFFGGQIKKPARTSEVFFKQNKNGSIGNRFVKKEKSNFAQTVNIAAHVINIPARPMLPVDAQGNLLPRVAENLLDMFADYILE